jgi:hypothetical protein
MVCARPHQRNAAAKISRAFSQSRCTVCSVTSSVSAIPAPCSRQSSASARPAPNEDRLSSVASASCTARTVCSASGVSDNRTTALRRGYPNDYKPDSREAGSSFTLSVAVAESCRRERMSSLLSSRATLLNGRDARECCERVAPLTRCCRADVESFSNSGTTFTALGGAFGKTRKRC